MNTKLKSRIMKKTILIITFASLLISCNINPNKEARIQKLETEIQMATVKINDLDKRVESLEVVNEQLKTRIDDLEKR